MPSFEPLVVFLAAAFLFAASPGPAVFYIVTRSLSQGRGSGLVSTMAIASANLAHAIVAAIGLSALLAASAIAFSIVKYLGAAYLIYLGVRTLLNRSDDGTDQPIQLVRKWQVYRQGVVVGILNPKTALFFLAFLPQFVEPSGAPTSVQIGFLGALLVTVTAISDAGYALVAGTAGEWIRRSTRLRQAGQVASGATYIALGTTAALVGEKPASST